MEGVSKEDMRDLERQTGQLKNINNKVHELNDELDHSNSIMSRIMKKENRNKVMIGVFSIAILLIFGLIMYFKFA